MNDTIDANVLVADVVAADVHHGDNQTFSRRAARLATLHRLRGADAVYVAVAAEYGAILITWDVELLQRGANAVTAMTPADWLANPPPL